VGLSFLLSASTQTAVPGNTDPAVPLSIDLPVKDTQKQRFDPKQIRIVGSSHAPERLNSLTQPLIAQRRTSVAFGLHPPTAVQFRW